MMGELYAVEREVPNPWSLTEFERADAFKLRAKLRDEKSRPITKRIKAWAMVQLALKESDFRKAVEYMLGHWDKLRLFLDDPYIPLGTNEIERGFRGPVVGRKNQYGSKSLLGTEVAAIFYSLIESAKLCGINSQQYLLDATKRLLRDPEGILLPHEIMEFCDFEVFKRWRRHRQSMTRLGQGEDLRSSGILRCFFMRAPHLNFFPQRHHRCRVSVQPVTFDLSQNFS